MPRPMAVRSVYPLEQPLLNPSTQSATGFDSTPVASFVAPNWVLCDCSWQNNLKDQLNNKLRRRTVRLRRL